MKKEEFQSLFTELTDIRENPFHPLVWIGGEPEIGKNVYIGGMSEVNAKGANVLYHNKSLLNFHLHYQLLV